MPHKQTYLDHAATTPLLPSARDAIMHGFDIWANPSSPHKAGRIARAALEDARVRMADVLNWDGEIVFTSGASEALALAISGSVRPLRSVSPVEHDAVLRHCREAARFRVDAQGRLDPASAPCDGLVVVQQVNNETGVVQPLEEIAVAVHDADGLLLADCAQGAGKIARPPADMIAIAAHKFGGPVGIGALLVRDWALLRPSGGQERGYRAGTENLPAILGMVAALEAGNAWMEEAVRLRALLEDAMVGMGGEVIAGQARRIPSIGAYRLPGVSAASQMIRFDALALAVSAGSACSSGSIKTSHVLGAMGLDDKAASEVIRVSIGRETTEVDIRTFLEAWTGIARARAAA